MNELTKRQTEVLSFIYEFKQAKGYSASYRDIACHFGFSTKAAFDHMKALQKKNGFASLNAFLIDSIRKKEIRLVEPRYRNAIADTFLYSEVPSILWSIEDEKLVSTRGKATVPYFIYKSDEGFRFICASDYTKDTFTYNPLSANADGDLTWYDGKSKEKLVTKNFNGMCLATVIRNSEFPKFLKNKS